MHLDDFQSLPVEFKWKCELLQCLDSFEKTQETLHIFAAMVSLVLLEQLIVVVHVEHVQVAGGAE